MLRRKMLSVLENISIVIKTSELVENYKRDLEKQVEGEQDGEKKE